MRSKMNFYAMFKLMNFIHIIHLLTSMNFSILFCLSKILIFTHFLQKNKKISIYTPSILLKNSFRASLSEIFYSNSVDSNLTSIKVINFMFIFSIIK